MIRLLCLLAFAALASQAPPQFDYDRTRPIDIKETSTRMQDGVSLREVTYPTLDGGRNGATIAASTIVTSKSGMGPQTAMGPRPAVLFVHWYGPPEPTSNRTQFIPDAIELAKAGTVSLLIDTPWSHADYMAKRTRVEDYRRSVQQVKDLRRALDVLLSLPDVDPARVAFVGHDFGAMYGTLAVVGDPRIRFFVFIAGTEAFSDWFLFGRPKLDGAARQAFVDELAPLDPVRYLPKLKTRTLLQFANDDFYVPKERMDRMIAATAEPKESRVYSAKHDMNAEATRDRIAWLKKHLGSP